MTAVYDPEDVRTSQRFILERSGVDLSPEFEHALWPTPERPKEKIVTGGVQAGKSTSGAAETYIELPLIDLDAAKVEPYRYWYIVPSYKTPKTELEYLRDWCRSFYGTDSIRDHMPDADSAVLEILGGRVIVETRTSQNPEAIAARAVNGVVVVEAGSQPEVVRRAALERVLTRRGWVVYTGTLEDDDVKVRYAWYDQLAQKWRQDWSEGVAVSLPTWANLAKYPGGRSDPAILDMEARMIDFEFLRRIAGEPAGVQWPVYGETQKGDWDSKQLGDVSFILPHGAGGYDYGETNKHPSVQVVVGVTNQDIAVVRDAIWDYSADPQHLDLQRKMLSHDYGVPLSRWGFDPMLTHSAKLVGAAPMEEAQRARKERVARVRGRFNGRLYFDLSKEGVRRGFEQMKRIHWIVRDTPQGQTREYHRADDDFAAALENAVTVIDTQIEMPTSVARPDYGRRVTRVGAAKW